MNPLLLLVAIFLVAINGLGFFLMGYDKASSRTSKNGERRIKESELFFVAILGGAVGLFIGMFLFRHKTKKLIFLLGLPILVLQHILLLQAYWEWILNT